MIDNDVILDGEGQLTVDGGDAHPMLEVAAERTVELRSQGYLVANLLAGLDPVEFASATEIGRGDREFLVDERLDARRDAVLPEVGGEVGGGCLR